MSIDILKPDFELALAAKLSELTRDFDGVPLRQLDIGVFPWHGTVELSLLLAEDTCASKDIAAWPNYNVSAINLGKWPEAKDVCQKMHQSWLQDRKSSAQIFQLIADIMRGPQIDALMHRFNRSAEFTVTLFDPDDHQSRNFCADSL